jgi:putative ABC transport system permease protein
MVVAMRHGAHAVWRSRGFALLVALLVAPAVGMAIVVFSAGRVLFLDPLPYPQADQLVTLGLIDLTGAHPAAWVSAPVVAAWSSRSSPLADVAAFHMSGDTRTGVANPELLSAALVGPSFFHLLGVRPWVGRSFLASEMTAGHDDAVVLSFDLWMNEFGGTTDLAGTTISLDGRRYRVVGVMPKGFTFPPGHTALWRPLVISDALARSPGLWGHAIGRLKPGVSPAAATRDLQAMQTSIAAEFPVLRPMTPSVVSFRAAAAGDRATVIAALAGASVCLILIAGANVGTLFALRVDQRRAEFNLRLALGAPRRVLVAQAAVEGLVIGLAASVVSVGVAAAALRAIRAAMAPMDSGAVDPLLMDPVIAIGSVVAVSLACAACSIVAAIGADRSGVRLPGRPVIGGRIRKRSVALVLQAGLSMVLLVSCGVLVQTVRNLNRVDTGFSRRGILTASVRFSAAVRPDPDRCVSTANEILDRARQLPAVTGAGATLLFIQNEYALGTRASRSPSGIGTDGTVSGATVDPVSTGYFAAMGTPVLDGRDVLRSDTRRSAPVALIDASLARALWPQGSPVGSDLYVAALGPRPVQVVGVVQDMRRRGLDRDAGYQVYVPLAQSPPAGMTLVIRTTNPEPLALTNSLHETVRAADSEAVVSDVNTVEGLIDGDTRLRRLQGGVLAYLSLCALLCASLGLYAVTDRQVVARSREIALRVAIGADTTDVAWLVLSGPITRVAIGIIVGAVGCELTSTTLRSVAYGVGPFDPAAIGLAGIVLLTVTVVACAAPVRQALRVDPVRSLRGDS